MEHSCVITPKKIIFTVSNRKHSERENSTDNKRDLLTDTMSIYNLPVCTAEL